MNILLSLLLLNDGYLESGEGPARLGKSPTTVGMTSEDIRLTVGRNSVRTTCDFVFNNRGPATTVRMGFPNSMDNMEEEDYAKPLKPILERFRTWVDGREVRAKLVRAAKDDPEWSYYVKPVSFAKNGRRRVRVTYSTGVGVLATDTRMGGGRYTLMGGYILSSGKGWRGKIGTVSVAVTFLPSSGVKSPTKAYREIDDSGATFNPQRAKIARDPRTVWVSGPGNVRTHGRTVQFRVKDLEPEKTDNVFVKWGLVTDEQWEARTKERR
ncbi:hypothetical protein EON81_16830 [bacterium]|nr:MAG: hypothetical protein EON81_16830 [bacterium]